MIDTNYVYRGGTVISSIALELTRIQIDLCIDPGWTQR